MDEGMIRAYVRNQEEYEHQGGLDFDSEAHLVAFLKPPAIRVVMGGGIGDGDG
jgi:hypothetical protein